MLKRAIAIASALLPAALGGLLLLTGCGPAGSRESTGAGTADRALAGQTNPEPAAAPAPAPPPAIPTVPAPEVVAAVNRGVALMGQYQYAEAVAAFEEALRLQPDLTLARVNLAIALFNRGQQDAGDIERAGQVLDEALAREPDNLRALYFKAIVLQHVGRTAEAIPLLQQVVERRPEDGVAWYVLGLCKQRVNQPAEAELLKAVERRPYLYSAWYKLFSVAVAAKQPEKARAYMERFKAAKGSPLGEAVELPQYNQMGRLALAQPLPVNPAAAVEQPRLRWSEPRDVTDLPGEGRVGLAAADFNRDGAADVLLVTGGGLKLLLADGKDGGGFTEATAGSGLTNVAGAVACAVGDYDNDEVADLFVACAGADHLFRGKGDGTFSEVTGTTGTSGEERPSRVALFLDADHDADLDLLVGGPDGLRYFGNKADGTFTNLTEQAGLACAGDAITGLLPGDWDGDRDADLVVLRRGAPARFFRNELLSRFVEQDGPAGARGDGGGAFQDFNGDATPDLLLLGGEPPRAMLWPGDGAGGFGPGTPVAEAGPSPGADAPAPAMRIADADLDGDLDLLLTGNPPRLWLNDGRGRFAPAAGTDLRLVAAGRGALWADLTGDAVPDLLTAGGKSGLRFRSGGLERAAAGVRLALTGVRGRDGRTRSPATGFGARLTLRAGLREQSRLYTGLDGGPEQSWLPAVFGLGDAAAADYLRILWPDGVAQVEMNLAAGQLHKFSELQRKVSSCPVLFAWDGRRFGFVTDFAGVGGLGYFAAPGEYSQPQVEEHVKIEPGRLVPKDGACELRITEPMEEVAYVDRLELLAVDHPAGWSVFPDERLALGGPPPTHDLLVVRERRFPIRAVAPAGTDCAAQLRAVDRRYAYEPELDRRFLGFCRPHTLELDFGDRLADLAAARRVFLFVNGFIEYPYSSTVYAAAQAGVEWESIRIDAAGADGVWRTIVPDAGVPGGMARMFTVELSGRLDGVRRLRLTTNLEVYYDQIFVARDAGLDGVTVHRLPLRTADFRRVGFAREFSPDGRLPLIYDYDLTEATAPFHTQSGPYTRYGPVTELLTAFDDRYVMVGPGDEIAVRFDPPPGGAPPAGTVRSFVLVSHAYCKDMDLYTATPETVEPLPFRGMSRYPYPPTEHFPATPAHRAWQQAYNTRRVGETVP